MRLRRSRGETTRANRIPVPSLVPIAFNVKSSSFSIKGRKEGRIVETDQGWRICDEAMQDYQREYTPDKGCCQTKVVDYDKTDASHEKGRAICARKKSRGKRRPVVLHLVIVYAHFLSLVFHSTSSTSSSGSATGARTRLWSPCQTWAGAPMLAGASGPRSVVPTRRPRRSRSAADCRSIPVTAVGAND